MSIDLSNLDSNLVVMIVGALGLLVVDAVIAVAKAVKGGNFSIQKLPAVVETSLAPIGTGLGVGAIVQSALDGTGATITGATVGALAVAVAIRALADIKAKLGL